MTEIEKKQINLKNNIEYFKFKINSNNKYIDFLNQENEIYKKMYKIYRKQLEDLFKEDSEIEVLE